MLNINDVFWTIQGEGTHAGRRALFVRMPFCNLACEWCDTTFNTFKAWTEEELLAFALQEPSKFAVLTGGEPMMNKHSPQVISVLRNAGFEVACETNGTYPILNGVSFVTVSPKRQAEDKKLPPYFVHEDAMEKAHEFKYVVDFGFDWEILKRHKITDGRRYSLSPEFGRFKNSVSEILEYLKLNPGWRMSLQTHKWVGVP